MECLTLINELHKKIFSNQIVSPPQKTLEFFCGGGLVITFSKFDKLGLVNYKFATTPIPSFKVYDFDQLLPLESGFGYRLATLCTKLFSINTTFERFNIKPISVYYPFSNPEFDIRILIGEAAIPQYISFLEYILISHY